MLKNFKALQIIVFFGSIVSILYYFHIIQSVLSAFAAFMRITLATTAAESLNCMACIFLGTVMFMRSLLKSKFLLFRPKRPFWSNQRLHKWAPVKLTQLWVWDLRAFLDHYLQFTLHLAYEFKFFKQEKMYCLILKFSNLEMSFYKDF